MTCNVHVKIVPNSTRASSLPFPPVFGELFAVVNNLLLIAAHRCTRSPTSQIYSQMSGDYPAFGGSPTTPDSSLLFACVYAYHCQQFIPILYCSGQWHRPRATRVSFLPIVLLTSNRRTPSGLFLPLSLLAFLCDSQRQHISSRASSILDGRRQIDAVSPHPQVSWQLSQGPADTAISSCFGEPLSNSDDATSGHPLHPYYVLSQG